MKILALDPGKTTGYALFEPPLNVLEVGEIWQCSPDDPRILGIIRRLKPDEVVIEKFQLYPGTKGKSLSWDDMLVPQIVSAVRLWCQERKIYFVEQRPMVKQAVGDAILKAVGGYARGRPHARDAVRHAIYRAWYSYDYQTEKPVVDILRRVALGKEELDEPRGARKRN